MPAANTVEFHRVLTTAPEKIWRANPDPKIRTFQKSKIAA
jgi:uncharacterized protein YndB with AHSA1/START domain